MKKNPADKVIRERLEPGALSSDGFLGTDDRPLRDIIAADCAEIEIAGLTVEQIGEFLEELHRAADAGWESAVPLFDGRIRVRVTETMGRVPCPFGCNVRSHKAVIEVRFGDDVLQFTPLDAHLIRAHGFFEGKGSANRLEPRVLIRLYRLCHDRSGD